MSCVPARVAAVVILASHEDDNVPMLIVKAPQIGVNSGISSGAWTIAGDAPAASTTLAAMFIAT